MKIATLIKGFSALVVTAVGVTSGVVFSNINNVTTGYVSIFTKEEYKRIMAEQSSLTNKNYNIDYNALPKTNIKVSDLITGNHSKKQGFIFTLGSQAYSQTNLLLNGNENDFTGNEMVPTTNSLMLSLYDEVFNNNKITDYDVNFYSYLDIVNKKEYLNAANLLHTRKTTLGDLEPDGYPSENTLESNRWQVLNEKGVWDPATNNVQPVVKNGKNFDFTPNTKSFYEFRKDAKHDTDYQKVYFRNDEPTRLFESSMDWLQSYANNDRFPVSVSNQGSVITAKYENSKWVFSSFSSSSLFKKDSIESTIESITDFFTKD
ncbi:MAG: hypothetical protein ACRC4L_01565 [Mycoplasma sp.]